MHIQLAKSDGTYTLLPYHGLKNKQTVTKNTLPLSTATTTQEKSNQHWSVFLEEEEIMRILATAITEISEI